MQVSVSLSHDKTSERHSRRDYTPANVEPTLSGRNVRVIDSPSFQDAFNEIFADAIDDYNARQKRADRMKSHDYWSDVESAYKAAKGEKPNVAHTTYTYVLQLGDRDSLGVTDDEFDGDEWAALKAEDTVAAADYVTRHLNNSSERDKAKECLTEFVKTLPDLYPQFRFIEIIGHDDEPNGTFHFDLVIVPVGEGYKTGLSKRDSLTKALNMMGFKSNKADGLAVEQWQDDVKSKLQDFMLEYNFEREFKDNHEKHRSIGTFQMEQRLDQLADDIAVSEAIVADAEEHVAAIVEREAETIDAASEAVAELELARRAKRQAEDDAEAARERAELEKSRTKKILAERADTSNAYAEKIRASAQADAKRIRDKAKSDAEGVKTDATNYATRIREQADADAAAKIAEAAAQASKMLEDATALTEEDKKLRESFKQSTRPQSHERSVIMVIQKVGEAVASFLDEQYDNAAAYQVRSIWERYFTSPDRDTNRRNLFDVAKRVTAAIWPTKEQRQAKQRAAEHASKLDAFKVRLRTGAAGAPVSDVSRGSSSKKSAIPDSLAQRQAGRNDSQYE